MSSSSDIYLRAPERSDRTEVLDAYKRSAGIHKYWACPPPNIDEYLSDQYRFMVCSRETDALVGTFHISGIVRGWFQSAYLGYEVFSPYQGKGYMTEGLKLLLTEAFGSLNLHRLEANIQPDNTASIRLVSGAGFVKEGYSQNYLRVGGGEWKDHERWAILNPKWRES